MFVPTQKLYHSNQRNNGNSVKTHCIRGHEFNEENTYISPKSRKRSCRICDKLKDQERYNLDPEAVKQAGREHMRAWRAANKDQDRKNYTELRRRKKEWLDAQKVACKICGESRSACLDFHHRDASKKDADVSVAIAHWSIKRLQKEIDKCDIICSNCHRVLHAEERETVAISST